MVSLVDVDLNKGDASRAAKALSEAAKEPAAEPTKPAAAASGNPADPPADEGRFAGKSRDDILRSYEHLESHNGRLANELGQVKRTLDELLIEKRVRDLAGNGAKPVEVDPAALLTKPKEVLDQYVDAKARELVAPLQEKLTNLEAALANTQFNSRHSDMTQITASPEFKTWVRGTALRQQLAANASQGNMQAADALLTEFKETRTQQPASRSNLEDALKKADKASLEGSGADAASTKPSGTVYKRADIIALRTRDPEAYERLGPQILQAYREGRVVD